MRERLNIKVLVLGAGGSGKTTMRKQLAAIYTGAFANEDARKEVRDIIISNLLEGAQAIVEASFVGGVGSGLTEEASLAAAKHINSIAEEETKLTDETVAALKTLWNDKAFQETVELRNSFQLQECVLPFFAQVQTYPTWGGPDWVPSKPDCVRARIRSSGVVELKFEVGGVTYRVFDAGGQRAERRKWIHHFDDVNCLMFMGSLTDYSEVLYEDSSKNRLEESLTVFEDLCRTNNWSTILLLNKLDLFKERFLEKRVPLNVSGLFPNAPTSFDLEAAFKWMGALYQEKMWRGGHFAVHAFSAVEEPNVRQLFEEGIKVFVLKSVLKPEA